MKRFLRPAPFSTSSFDSTWVLSSRRTPDTSAAVAVKLARRNGIARNLKTIFDSRGPESGARAARGMALHVHRHGIHGDVRGGGLDVHGEGGGVAAQALRADAQHVDRLAEL